MMRASVCFNVQSPKTPSESCISVQEAGEVVVKQPGTQNEYHYSYASDRHKLSNQEAYDRVGKPVVDAVLKGCNGAVLAYGQTGCGTLCQTSLRLPDDRVPCSICDAVYPLAVVLIERVSQETFVRLPAVLRFSQ